MNLVKIKLFILFIGISIGNILPPEESQLNYTQVFHRWDQIPGAEEYLFTITDMDSDYIQEMITSSNSIMTDLSEWGRLYEWSACGMIDGETIEQCTDIYSYSIYSLPSYFPDEINISILDTNNMQQGITMMDCESLLLSVALKSNGDPIWFSPLNSSMNRFVFTQFLENGNILGFGYGSGYEINLEGELLFQTPSNHAVHHHFNKTANDTYFLIGAVVEDQYCPDECNPSLPDEIPWQGDVFIEIDKQGNTIWEWNTFNHISLNEYNPYYVQVYNGNNEMDWTHSNSVHFDANSQSVFVSIRNLTRVTKIDYNTKEIVWNLGKNDYLTEISFAEELNFSQQHSVQVLENGNLLFFDNHRYLQPELSRCLEVSINEGNQTAEIVWEHTLPAELFTGSRGECDRLDNGNTLITIGRTGHSIEVSPEGEEVWHLIVKNSGFDVTMYRSSRIDNLHPIAFSANVNEAAYIDNGLTLHYSDSITLNIHNQSWHSGNYIYQLIDNNSYLIIEGEMILNSYETTNTIIDVSSINSNISSIIVYPEIAPEKAYNMEFSYSNNTLTGDLNEDNLLNILDIVILVNYILDDNFLNLGDLNQDGVNNILDIVILANLILETQND